MPLTIFTLMFPLGDVNKWACQYPYEKNDVDAFAAGERILARAYTRSNLKEIVKWKSSRRLDLIDENTDAEIEDALKLAIAANEPRSAIAVLKGLNGVDLPVASAILTALDQVRYTVADWRAMEALGQPDADYYNINLYVADYLPECKRLAAAASVPLRTFDKALWTWSVKNGKSPKSRGSTSSF